jgi:hypothetical protein
MKVPVKEVRLVNTAIRPPLEFIRAADEAAECRASATSVLFLDIPRRRYLAIDGTAPPGSEAFRQAIASLYAVAYRVHFSAAHADQRAEIGHLHGLYWFDAAGRRPMGDEAPAGDGPMRWQLLITLPDSATEHEVAAAIEHHAAGRTTPELPPHVVSWEEGPVAQLMHIGPYDAEQPTLDRLRTAIAEAGLLPHGCHHEIYLSGPRTKPGHTQTVLRQPVAA